ncbi:MAG: SNF2-related protein [candidate division Zixibacteria bacterium]|nr:SNF2-related protein [candidate division Zixibacteria bacterium]
MERSKLKLVSKIFPVKRTEILLLDKLEIDLKEAKINQINIPSISSPQITTDFCPVNPEIIELKTLLEDRGVMDLTLWLKEQLSYPEIEFFPLLLNLPKKAGKSYGQIEVKDRQATLFEPEEGNKDCIHGMKKSWCHICIENEKRDREKAESGVDTFDLIFPILQPPLGENFDSPIAFQLGREPYPFQRVGVKFLLEHERALLGDEMGLGKSIQAIVAIRFLFRMGKVTNGLILCPKSVLTDWERKLWEWAPELRVIKVRGPKEQREVFWNSPAHIYLTTYETMRQDLVSSLGGVEVEINADGSHIINCPNKECSERLRMRKELLGIQVQCPTCHHVFSYTPGENITRKQFDLIVLDEIQKIKNPGADITKATRQIDARFRWGLSGTPLENRLEELISIFAYLKPGLLHYDDASKPKKIKTAINPYLLRRRKTDALPELPEKFCDEKWLELSSAQREAYIKAEQEGIVALNDQGDSVTIQHILALITKLKQICNIDPATKESCKLEYLLEKLEEVTEQDDKALVFSQYPEKTLKFLEPELKRFNPLVYHGSLSDSQRDNIVKKFQDEEDSKVLLISVKAGGLGLTLTRANYVYHFDMWWNPAVAAQAEDRAHRIGQKKRVFVTSLLTVNTIEERIQNLLDSKRQLFKEVIDDLSDSNLSRVMTEDELFGLFGLQKSKRASATKIAHKNLATPELLTSISPPQFEELISNLYAKMGYHVKLTPQTKDRGIDIYAKRLSESGTESLAIQCKHYPNGIVGVEHVRSLYGVIHDQPSITKGVLITSGEFSKECKQFANGKRIELFDGTYLCGLLEKYNISI